MLQVQPLQLPKKDFIIIALYGCLSQWIILILDCVASSDATFVISSDSTGRLGLFEFLFCDNI